GGDHRLDGLPGAVEAGGVGMAADGLGQLFADAGPEEEDRAGALPAVGGDGGENLPDGAGEAQGVEGGGDLLEEAVLGVVQDADGGVRVLSGLDGEAAARAEVLEATLDEEGLAVGEEEAGLDLEAEHDPDRGLDDLVPAVGQGQDVGQVLQGFFAGPDIHDASLR